MIVIVISGVYYLFSDNQESEISDKIENELIESEEKNKENTREDNSGGLKSEESKVKISGMYWALFGTNSNGPSSISVSNTLSSQITTEIFLFCAHTCLSKNFNSLQLRPIENETFGCYCGEGDDWNAYQKEIELDVNKGQEYLKKLNDEDQFPYSGVHWNHMPITYKIRDKDACGEFQTMQIYNAFETIEEVTQRTVNFKEVNQYPDIEFYCTIINCGNQCYLHNKAHEMGYVLNNMVYYSRIEMFGTSGESGFNPLRYPGTEVHEILHTFGFEHNNIRDSIMSHEVTSGKQRTIDNYIIQELKRIYGNK